MPEAVRQTESRREQIMAAALTVFSTKGYEKATNKDIAEAAGIKSAGLIYHYFKDKWDLFSQMIEARAPALQLVSRGDELMSLPPREALARFAHAFMQSLDSPPSIALFKVMLAESIYNPEVADAFNRVGPGRALGFLRRYLAHQMDAGHLRRMEPGAAARTFAGPLIVFILTREIMFQPDSPSLTPETMVQTTVDIFLEGMEPHRGRDR